MPKDDCIMAAVKLEDLDLLADGIGDVELVADPVDGDRLGEPQRR